MHPLGAVTKLRRFCCRWFRLQGRPEIHGKAQTRKSCVLKNTLAAPIIYMRKRNGGKRDHNVRKHFKGFTPHVAYPRSRLGRAGRIGDCLAGFDNHTSDDPGRVLLFQKLAKA